MNRVAVIGGGPSGLVAAKTLLHQGLIPVIFESSSEIGGLWNPINNRLWNSSITNVSNFTCSFTDFPWIEEPSSVFPNAQEVYQYLHQYSQHFIPPGNIKFNSTIKRITRIPHANSYHLTWTTTTATEGTAPAAAPDGNSLYEESEVFQQVILATGFFTKPRIPSYLEEMLSDSSVMKKKETTMTTSEDTTTTTATMKTSTATDPSISSSTTPSTSTSTSKVVFTGEILHALDYFNPKDYQNKTVAIIGGAFSGSEIATEVAQYARKVFHIAPSPTPYIIPRYLPEDIDKPDTAFLPLDFIYNKLIPSRREDFVKKVENGDCLERVVKSKGEKIGTFTYFNKLTGFTPRDPIMDADKPLYLSICENYYTMVNCNAIEQVGGYLRSFTGPQSLSVSSNRQGDLTDMKVVDGVDTVIFCTGYSPKIDFLDEDILNILKYDPNDLFLPLELFKDILHPELPNMYFVGMYRGPYFAILQLQAELAVQYIAGNLKRPSMEEFMKLKLEQKDASTYRDWPISHRPQFPHGDYLGQMLDLYYKLHRKLPSRLNESYEGLPVIPGALFDPTDQAKIDTKDPVNDMKRIIDRFRSGWLLSRNIIDSLAYTKRYKFNRMIIDHLNGEQVTNIEGHVNFTSINRQFRRLLYHEEGKMFLGGRSYDVSQNYVYEYNKEKDTLDISFSKVGAPEEIDRPFISLAFSKGNHDNNQVCSSVQCGSASDDILQQPMYQDALASIVEDSESETGFWVSYANHLCGEDLYRARYALAFQGLKLATLRIVFEVRGPSKDYRAVTILSAE